MCHNKPFYLIPGRGEKFASCFGRFEARSTCRLFRDFRHDLLGSLVKHKVFTWFLVRQLRYSLLGKVYIASCFDPYKSAVVLSL
jgi:hypothetical protein